MIRSALEPAPVPAGIEHAFQDALKEKVFSGASLVVADSGGILLHHQWGSTRYGGPPVGPDTWFDLASLTKPLAAASLSLCAVADGRLGLDDSLQRFFPDRPAAGDAGSITMRHLLNHCSGLPPHRPYYLELIREVPERRRDALLDRLLHSDRLAPPGYAVHYSDLGFMLLGIILETVFEQPLDQLFTEKILTPLGIEEMRYGRLQVGCDPLTPARRTVTADRVCVATEHCPWRSRLLEGEVHDENGYCLEAVAGHAGLFGTARAVFELLAWWWRLYRGDSETGSRPGGGSEPAPEREGGDYKNGFCRSASEALPEDEGEASPAASRRMASSETDRSADARLGYLVREFWRRQDLIAGSTWAIGFDTPSPGRSSAGVHFSPHSVGHLGFTGTSFWLDPEQDIMVVLLTNRVHPNRDNPRLEPFRPLVHNLVMESRHDLQRS